MKVRVAQPIIINGRIVSIAIIASGNGYTSPPRVVINGEGYGAVGKAIIGQFGEDAGKVLGVTVENRGVGYATGTTTIRLEAIGENAVFNANVFEWTKNLQTNWMVSSIPPVVMCSLVITPSTVVSMLTSQDPKQLRYVLGDNVFRDPATGNLRELETGLRHSPIIGWAYDGNPIYGPYGYIDAADQSSGIKRVVSSYRIKPVLLYDEDTNPNPVRADGPLLTAEAAGSFIEDYEYVFQQGRS